MCGDTESGGLYHCRHVGFLIGNYPKVGKDPITRRIDSLVDAKNSMEVFEDGQDEYQERLKPALDKQQSLLDWMVCLLEGSEIWMRTLESLAGVLTGVPAPGLDMPRDPAPEALLRQMKTLRMAM